MGDIFKTDVYALAENINAEREVISDDILKKAPSAELCPNQKDEDQLMPYSELDPILKSMVEDQEPFDDKRFDKETWAKVAKWLQKSEFKRRQAPLCLKVSDYPFGDGRRFPIAARITDFLGP